MYNFLDPKLSPKVTSTVPATDNYEVTNLISGNFVTKSRGFLAYSTVKPPVEITFELICPINIHYIVLWTAIGKQKCTAIDILAKNCNREFTSIAYARFNNNNGIVFCNCRIYSINNPPPNIDQTFHLSFFKHSSFRSFTTANIIKVCIVQTERSVPCLGKIEIWGKPSKMCSLVTVNTINHLMQAPVNNLNHPTTGNSSAKLTKPIDDWEIPDDFKDSLTFEVMAIPITLPSGNNIDQSTLEKYVANEASYGRAASDPFTSQKFTDARKPMFNAALKSRIDMFLMQHSHRTETFAIKRTVGSKINIKINDETKIRKLKPEDTLEVVTKKMKFTESLPQKINIPASDVDEKLNDAIKKTINSNNFICFTDEEQTVIPDILHNCVQCKSNDNLYSISCKHLYCRNCLLDVCKELKCRKCGKSFCRSDPKKFHL